MANSINVIIPNSDMPFFRKLSVRMGWTYSDSQSCHEKEEALSSIEQGFRELKAAQDNGSALPGVDQLFEELQTL